MEKAERFGAALIGWSASLVENINEPNAMCLDGTMQNLCNNGFVVNWMLETN